MMSFCCCSTRREQGKIKKNMLFFFFSCHCHRHFSRSSFAQVFFLYRFCSIQYLLMFLCIILLKFIIVGSKLHFGYACFLSISIFRHKHHLYCDWCVGFTHKKQNGLSFSFNIKKTLFLHLFVVKCCLLIN